MFALRQPDKLTSYSSNTHRSTLVEIFGLRLGLLSPNLPPDGNQHQTKNHSTATLIVTNLPESVKRIYTYTRTSMKKPNSPEAKPQPHALDPAEKRRLQNRRAQHNYRKPPSSIITSSP